MAVGGPGAHDKFLDLVALEGVLVSLRVYMGSSGRRLRDLLQAAVDFRFRFDVFSQGSSRARGERRSHSDRTCNIQVTYEYEFFLDGQWRFQNSVQPRTHKYSCALCWVRPSVLSPSQQQQRSVSTGLAMKSLGTWFELGIPWNPYFRVAFSSPRISKRVQL